MPTVATLALSLFISMAFSSYPPIPFRGELVPAGYRDSLAGVVRGELDTLEVIRGRLDRKDRSLDSLFARWPDDGYYLNEKRKVARFRETADSLRAVLEGELEGLGHDID